MKYSALNLASALLRGWWAVKAATWGVISRRAVDQQAAIDRALELRRRLALPEAERLDIEEDERLWRDDEFPLPVFMSVAEIPFLPASLKASAAASGREGSAL